MRSSILFDRRFIINTENLTNLYEYYKEGKIAHAYLISTNNTQKIYDILLNVIKNIFCHNMEDDKRDSLCHLIDINNLPSLQIIVPDGNFIKKNQILELENKFSKLSQYTKESIYVIKNCEKMNKESANTMLKFLEEPSDNIIGFFITNNYNNVIPTIQSRCQKIEINFNNEIYEKIDIKEEKYLEYMDTIKNYLYSLEVEKKDLILYNRIYLSLFEKEDIVKIFQIILDLYEKALANNEMEFDYLLNLSKKNIREKIKLLIEVLKQISYNVNLEMLLDKFVIEVSNINESL